MTDTQAAPEGPAVSDKSPAADHQEEGHHGPKVGFWPLWIGCIGVVYGDIGTSPLYAFREALAHASETSGAVSRADVLGIVSLILWALILIVTVKYVVILLRADNRGEGGTLTLMALAKKVLKRNTTPIFALGAIGAALFYADSILTPTISVLSAVEGLTVVEPGFESFVLPLSVVILVALFAVQSHGTARVAAFFGPVMLVWFGALAVSGALHIADDPGIFLAINPVYGLEYLSGHSAGALIALGSVFLAVTGAEALYADLGHFGRWPIQSAWSFFIFPSLALNYLGQGALVLAHPETAENPFFMMMPEWGLLPMVILATMATVIASQAVITGTYSLTRQAMQLGLLPRLEIRHTSEAHSGQIYIPKVNALMLIGVLLLVLMFRSSSNLASAYGLAVATSMLVDALLGTFVIWRVWNKTLLVALAMMVPFALVDSVFVGANMLKLVEGALLPLTLGVSLCIMMATWVKGTKILAEKEHRASVPLKDLLRSLEKRTPPRVPGTAVFLSSDPQVAPGALMHNLKHNKILHEQNFLLTVVNKPFPRVADEDRITVERVSDLMTVITSRAGYMETPNIPQILAQCRQHGLNFDMMSTSFFLGRRSIKVSAHSGMPIWQDKLYIALYKSSADVTDYFQIPYGRVVEMGNQVTV